jgi:hypothetical protein
VSPLQIDADASALLAIVPAAQTTSQMAIKVAVLFVGPRKTGDPPVSTEEGKIHLDHGGFAIHSVETSVLPFIKKYGELYIARAKENEKAIMADLLKQGDVADGSRHDLEWFVNMLVSLSRGRTDACCTESASRRVELAND